MKINNIEFSVRVKGNRVREFIAPATQQIFIEGRQNSEFSIEVKNNTASDVLAVLSVDGLSVIDGKPASSSGGGYVVKAHSTLDIEGWRVDSGSVAKFIFAGKTGHSDDSYVAQIGGDTANKGVIGLAVFAEEYRPREAFRGIAPSSISKGWSHNQPSGIMFASSMASNTPVGSRSLRSTASPVEQSLGAGFGDATDFRTETVQFKRGDLIGMGVIRYDDRKGLEARGIRFDFGEPNPFPADSQGCRPPEGWKR